MKTLAILRKPKYLFIAMLVAILTFSVAIWLPNLPLLTQVLHPDSAGTMLDKANFLLSLYGSIGTNFTLVSATLTGIISVLFGVYSALLTYYFAEGWNKHSPIKGASATSFSGLFSGFFGIGCATCGTFILLPVLTLIGAGGVLAFLPFGGEEFGFVGVGLLTYSVYVLSKKITRAPVCTLEDDET